MIETDMSDWDRDLRGEIETSPVAAWSVSAIPLNVLLRLEVLLEDGQIGTVQVHIPATEIPALTKALTQKAKRSLRIGPTGRA